MAIACGIAGYALVAILAHTPEADAPRQAAVPEFGSVLLAQARTCKQVSSCEEAVRLWCHG